MNKHKQKQHHVTRIFFAQLREDLAEGLAIVVVVVVVVIV